MQVLFSADLKHLQDVEGGDAASKPKVQKVPSKKVNDTNATKDAKKRKKKV